MKLTLFFILLVLFDCVTCCAGILWTKTIACLLFEHQKHLFQHGYSFKLHPSSKNQFYEYSTLMYSTRCILKREFLTFKTKRPPSLAYSISDPNSYLSQRKVARDHTLNNFHAPRPSPLPHRLLKCLLSFHFVCVPQLRDKILKISCKV